MDFFKLKLQYYYFCWISNLSFYSNKKKTLKKNCLKKLIEKSLGKRFDVWYMAFGICRRTSLNLSHSLKVFEYQVSLPEHYCKATSEKSLLHFKWQWHRFTWKSFSYKSRALNKTFYYYYLCWRYVPYYIAKF